MKLALRASCVAIIMAGGLAATPAWACGSAPSVQPAAYQQSGASLFHPAFFQNNDGVAIAGMWSFRMISGGQTVDFGYTEWHPDGTELMNSGGRAPATGNFCMGVWKQTGTNTYHLNHWALSYDSSSGALNAKVNLKEDVTLDSRALRYSGTFTMDVYDPNTNAVVQHAHGQVVGLRVTAN
ncbi:hypothetical protein [Sphingomonas sp.]|uniref:hypothetical protein n=1 Tax=Sphingomonas sp. TaxID=28214 RepID=UPI0025EDF1D9|nr:hypothetical protein [Sphingomonas sp.]MBV9528743.1 hypothetical protein [Sphingomonas sp.]